VAGLTASSAPTDSEYDETAPADDSAPGHPVPSRRRRVVVELAVVAVLLTAAVAVHWGAMGQRLVEEHGFRQTQTAMTAVDFKANGIDLLHPRVPVFGVRSEVPFEFPLFQALATVPMNLGLEADVAMRATALLCFLITAVLLYGLLRRVSGMVAAFGALVAFLFSPFGLQWSHASLVEYLATAGAVGFVWAGIEWRERRHWGFVALAVVAGSVAMLVKITTGVFWILPLVLYTAARETPGLRAWIRARLDPGLIVAVAVPLVAGFAWTRHADAIKDANAATRWLTSANLQTWNFGTLAQRQSSQNWTAIFDRMETLLVGRYLLLALIVVALWWGRTQRFWLGIVLVTVLAPAVFFNLYVVHDYYLAAISPALAALVGISADFLWAHRPRRWTAGFFAFVLVVAWLVWVIWPSAGYVDRMYHPGADPYEAVAAEVQQTTPPGAPVVYLGEDWNPTTPYYAGRPGLMLAPKILVPEVIDKLPQQGYRYVFSFAPTVDPIQILEQWPWVGVVGPRTYVVGSRREDVDHAPVYASTASSVAPIPGATTLACDDSRRPVPLIGSSTRLQIASATSDALRIWVRDDLAPLPRVGAIYLQSNGELHCTGTSSIEVATLSG
jgi:Dolichyl-phosphate-mannose-protein mannosyltransferase